MMDMPRAWATHRVAMDAARILAGSTGRRQRVIREDGGFGVDATRFRIVPDGECTCLWWTETVGPGLELPCAEQHQNCPEHPLAVYGNVPVAEPCS